MPCVLLTNGTSTSPGGYARRLRDAGFDVADREVLTLSVWEGLKPGEIAEHLGLEPGTVRARLSRARSRLRQLLHPQLHAAETP